MSVLTDFAKFFKYEPEKEKTKNFNITEALNNNWDKADAALKALTTLNALKANAADVYTKTAADSKLALKANAGFELSVIGISTISLSNVKLASGIYGKNQIGQVEISANELTLSSSITNIPTPFLQMPVGYYPHFSSRVFSVMLLNEGSNQGESGLVRISASNGLVTVQKASTSPSVNLKSISFSQVYTAG